MTIFTVNNEKLFSLAFRTKRDTTNNSLIQKQEKSIYNCGQKQAFRSNNMEIAKEILDKTTNCQKGFECLKNDDHIYCKVENCVSDNLHFVRCLSRDYCSYQLPFGRSHICNCPTRKEIFNKYGI